jgi:hypothetical protein
MLHLRAPGTIIRFVVLSSSSLASFSFASLCISISRRHDHNRINSTTFPTSLNNKYYFSINNYHHRILRLQDCPSSTSSLIAAVTQSLFNFFIYQALSLWSQRPSQNHRLHFVPSTRLRQIFAMDAYQVRYDTWVCGDCKALNLIATADTICPVCEHVRDYQIGCCTNPGEYLVSTGLFPDHPEYQNSDSSNDQDAYYQAASCSNSASYGYSMVDSPVNVLEGFNNLGHYDIQEPESRSWSDMPGSGSSAMRSISPPFNTLAGAGGVGDGVWVCQECQCPNSDICPACMSCGAARP